MRKIFLITSFSGVLLAAPVLLVSAQGPGGPGGGRGLSKAADVEDLVTRMMTFDQDKDGKVARAELTDPRLAGLFSRADVDKNGTVTKGELTTLAEKEYVGGRGGFGGPGGPGGFGGPPMATPGVILAPMLQQRLGLSNDQKAQLAELQSEVETKLEKILTKEQRSQLQQMRERGPGGPGGPGGRRGGPGGPGGGGPGGGGPGGPGGEAPRE